MDESSGVRVCESYMMNDGCLGNDIRARARAQCAGARLYYTRSVARRTFYERQEGEIVREYCLVWVIPVLLPLVHCPRT